MAARSSRLPRVRAAVAVIERGGRYLVDRRPAGVHLPGVWEFPGGKRRAGESWRACLRREVREELGINIRVIRRLEPITYQYPDRNVRLEVFRCAIQTGIPNPLQCQEIKWVTSTQLGRLRLPPANQRLVASLLKLRSARRRDITIPARKG